MRSLRTSFLWALTGNVVSAAAQWAVVIVLARIAGVETVGHYALALGITSPLLNLTNLQLRAVQATDTGSDLRFGHFVAMRLLTSLLFIASIGTLFLLSPWPAATIRVLLAVAFARLSESGSDLIYGQLQQQERMDRIAQSLIVRALSGLTVLVYSMANGSSPLHSIMLFACAGWLTLLLFDVPVAVSTGTRYSLRPIWQGAFLRRLFWLSLPLGFTQILNSLLANLPRYLLEHWHGAAAVGLFSAQAYVIVAANLLVVALGQAMAPRSARAFLSDLAGFHRLAGKLIVLAAAVGSGGLVFAILFGPRALSLIYGPGYGANPVALDLLMLAGAFSYVAAALGCCLTAARQFLPQVHILLVANAVTLTAGFFLVPQHGIPGAAVAQSLGYAGQCAASVYFLHCAIAARRRQHAPLPTLQSTLHTTCLES